MKGSTATLTSCGVNKSIDRRADGSPAEQPVPFYNFVGVLKQAGGEWRVVDAAGQGQQRLPRLIPLLERPSLAFERDGAFAASLSGQNPDTSSSDTRCAMGDRPACDSAPG